jgi:hypothetical protein
MLLAGSPLRPTNPWLSDAAICLGFDSPFWEERGSPVPQEQASPLLTLIKGAAEDVEFGLLPHGSEKNDWSTPTVERSLSRRPGDHVELWTFNNIGALETIRRAARQRGLNGDTAIALVVERRLVLEDLQAMATTDAEANLDRCASGARPTSELWSAHSAYLRHLRHGDQLERNSKLPLRSPRAALPIRLVDRLGERDVFDETPVSALELGHAADWEMAALYRGELMGEWAYRNALRTLVGDQVQLSAP